MYGNILAEAARKGITMQRMAEHLGIHRNTFQNKIDGASVFTWSEAYSLQLEFFPELNITYLFAKIQVA